ncbi:MAG: GNAT family N-acetyltransferase [Aurantibacter sp.]
MDELRYSNQYVRIEAGELVGYQVDGHEFIHQKGSPGWRNADTEMFPIIGPTAEAGFKVKTPRGHAVQDQHGLLRELCYELISRNSTSAVYQKKYVANSKVSNSKYPEKSTAKELHWPYGFSFHKRFELSENRLTISFKVEGEEGMPFMLGYHPAFNLHTTNPTIEADNRVIFLEEVLAVGSRALQVSDREDILLKDEKSLGIKTVGFGNFMLWTEVPNMVCIEPITFYPYAVKADELHTGFDYLGKDPCEFTVLLTPNEKKVPSKMRSKETILRTDAANQDFIDLVKTLDADLAQRDGADHSFYDQFNKIHNIGHALVLYNNDLPVACGAIKQLEPNTMEVKRMYTLPEFRGRGLASKTLAELENWARELGYHKCVLETGRRQPEAIALYKKKGYKIIPNYGQYIGIENSVCFEKHLV